MRTRLAALRLSLLPWTLAALSASAAPQAPAAPREPEQEQALFHALALAPEEREESLALSLRVAMRGDCEGALERLATIPLAAPGEADELTARVATERSRLEAWIQLRDACLAELSAGGKPLSLELDGKKLSTTFTREGDELLLARGPEKRLNVRNLPPETLLPAIPKERFVGAAEWLKIYPYCVSGNAKWKRLTTSDDSSALLKQEAESVYPRLWELGALVDALETLARRAPPVDAAEARARVAELEALLASGGEGACLRRRAKAIDALAERLLARVSSALELGDFVHASLGTPSEGLLRLTYDFSTPEQALDWIPDDAYLSETRRQLDPVTSGDESTRFAPGLQGFHGNGAVCWRHAIDFEAPARVRYRVRWEPTGGKEGQVFAFAMGLLGDAEARHVRCAELGFLYVDERDGRYLARRPSGDAVVQLGQTYEIELAADGRKAQIKIDGELRSEGDAKNRKQGCVFLWCHSDLLVSVPWIEIEGRVAPDSLARLRADWVRESLARLRPAGNR